MKIKLLFLALLISTGVLAQQDSISVQELQKLEKNFQQISLSLKSISAEVEGLNLNIEELNRIIDSQNNELRNLRDRNIQQEKKITSLEENNTKNSLTLDSLGAFTRQNSEAIVESSNNFNNRLSEETTAVNANFSRVDETLDRNQLLWIIGILSLLLIAGLIFFVLSRKINSSKTNVERQILETRSTLEEEAIKLDEKLLEILNTQLKLQSIPVATPTAPSPSSNGKDHKLALKVADEIIRIQKNLTRMDENTKGLKQLSASVQRIQDNFAANGYELVDMIGKDYNEGMKVTANFVPNEDLPTGKQVISRIIKPQVNYKEEMIQAAQIEVSVGE